MSQTVLEKRTSESILFDFDCTNSLAAGETISSGGPGTDDQSQFTYGTPVVNSVAVSYPDGTTAAAGKVMQVRISGGTIPTGSTIPDGRPGIRCTVRVPYVTTPNNNTREATVLLDLTNTPF